MHKDIISEEEKPSFKRIFIATLGILAGGAALWWLFTCVLCHE